MRSFHTIRLLTFLTCALSGQLAPADQHQPTDAGSVNATQGGVAIGGNATDSAITAGAANVVRSATYEAITVDGLDVIRRVAPSDVSGRLQEEGLKLNDTLKQRIQLGTLTSEDVENLRSQNSGPQLPGNPAGRLNSPVTRSFDAVSRREVTASSGGIAIGGSVSRSTVTAGTGNTVTTAAASSKVRVEALPSFIENTRRALTEKAAQPGFLRVWKGRRVIDPDPYLEAVLIPVLRKDGELSICSGALVAPDLVISAAHCLCNVKPLRVAIGTSGLLAAQFAEIDVPGSHSFISCDKISNDEDVLKNINQGDVALYKLTAPLNNIALRKIATSNMFQDAAAIRAVGFGKRDDGGVGTKFAVDIVIASFNCSEITAGNPDGVYQCAPTHELIAAGMDRDTCGGDSGSPVYILGGDVKLYIAAITSRSVDPKGSCGQGGIYVKLHEPKIKEWLLAKGVPASTFAQ